MGTRKVNLELINQAFALFVQGMSLTEIGTSLGVSRQTMTSWRKKNKWDEQLKSVNIKLKEKLGETLSEVKARQVKIAKTVQAMYIKRIQNKDPTLKVDYNDADRAMKHELLLIGEPTEREEVVGEKAPLTLTDLKKAFDDVHKSRLPNRDISETGCKDTSKVPV